ncbi:archease [Acidobacteriota bacterium]
MSERYTFLDHTADAKFRAYGKSLEEAFENSARAVISLMWDAKSIRPLQSIPIRIQGRDLGQLLLAFLEEILYLLDTRSFLLSDLNGTRIEKNEAGFTLESVFRGDTFGDGYEIFGEVKAATYGEMEIFQDKKWTIQVVVDM